MGDRLNNIFLIVGVLVVVFVLFFAMSWFGTGQVVKSSLKKVESSLEIERVDVSSIRILNAVSVIPIGDSQVYEITTSTKAGDGAAISAMTASCIGACDNACGTPVRHCPSRPTWDPYLHLLSCPRIICHTPCAPIDCELISPSLPST